MVKEKQHTPQPEPEVNDEIKDIMGPPPEEAVSRFAPFVDDSESSRAPSGPPEMESQDNEETLAIEANDKEGDIKVSSPKKEVDALRRAAEEANRELSRQIESTGDKQESSSAEDSISDELDDPLIDKAVSDIIINDSDELLAAYDSQDSHTEAFNSDGKSRKSSFFAILRSKKSRTLLLAVIAVLLLGFSLYPSTRYAALNAVGVKAGLSIKVVDNNSGLPIKNVEVVAGGQKGATDDKGNVVLSNVKLGKTQLVLTKRSFASKQKTIIVGWGSNPYTDAFQMEPTGSSYVFKVIDWLSGKPIAKAEVSDGDSTAVTDDSGKATLIVQPTDNDLSIAIKANDYRTDNTTIAIIDKDEKTIKLVAGRPEVFVSKRSGKFDVYKRDADGKNETVLISGSGSEQDPLGLLVHPDANVAAFVSSRDGKRDKNGYLLSNLYMIDIPGKTVSKVPGTETAQIQLIEWIGDKLIFVKASSGESAATAGRQQVLSYDYKQEKSFDIASANYFNDVEVFRGMVYYAPSSTGSIIGDAAKLYKINADGSAKTSLLDKEAWETYRTNYDKLQVSAADNKWYEQSIGENKMLALSGAPASPTHRIYIDAPSSSNTVWVDNRDGKGVLILQDIKTGAERALVSKGGLGYPVRWLSNHHIIFRVSNSQETADYVININGGEPYKIGDVTNTAATNRWYYYSR